MDRTGFEPVTPWSTANVVPPAFAGFRRNPGDEGWMRWFISIECNRTRHSPGHLVSGARSSAAC